MTEQLEIKIVYPSGAFILKELFIQGEDEGILYKDKLAIYFIGILNNEIIGIAGARTFLAKNKAILKGDYVKPSFRKRGVLTGLNTFRLAHLKGMGIKTIEANATKKALGVHLKAGASIVKELKSLTLIRYKNF